MGIHVGGIIRVNEYEVNVPTVAPKQIGLAKYTQRHAAGNGARLCGR